MVVGVPLGRLCAIEGLIGAEEVCAEDVYAVRRWRGGC